jgi:hypothetical protein
MNTSLSTVVSMMLTRSCRLLLEKGDGLSRNLRRYYQRNCKNVRHFTFVATTGRTGTRTLADIFAGIDDCTSLHEPYPVMNSELMIQANNGNDDLAEKTFYGSKLFYIYRACVKNKSKYYIETNHMFIKSFAEYAVEHFYPRINVIHLSRDSKDTAYSLYQLNTIPGTPEGNRWYLDYRATNNKIKISEYFNGSHEFDHPFYRCLWYVYEIEARIKYFKTSHPDIPVFEIFMSDLNSVDRLRELFDFLDMNVSAQYLYSCINKKLNQKLETKKQYNMPSLTTKEIQFMTDKLCSVINVKDPLIVKSSKII